MGKKEQKTVYGNSGEVSPDKLTVLEIGETGTIESTIGDYKVTVKSAEYVPSPNYEEASAVKLVVEIENLTVEPKQSVGDIYFYNFYNKASVVDQSESHTLTQRIVADFDLVRQTL
ncbi:hypothetical protein RZN22_02355 [Bacillaceae bacterium S4-13-58]